MKYQLIKLSNCNIIVSDEELTTGCYGITNTNNIVKFNTPYYGELEINKKQGTRKLVASDNPKYNLPSIDYNGLEDDFGIVDVEQIAVDFAGNRKLGAGHGYPSFEAILLEKGFIEGFNKAQSLNKKKYCLNDLKNAFNAGINYQTKPFPINKKFENEFIQSLVQPKVFDIEIDMKYFYHSSKEIYGKKADWVECIEEQYNSIKQEISTCPLKMEPKIIDNKIKILKIF